MPPTPDLLETIASMPPPTLADETLLRDILDLRDRVESECELARAAGLSSRSWKDVRAPRARLGLLRLALEELLEGAVLAELDVARHYHEVLDHDAAR